MYRTEYHRPATLAEAAALFERLEDPSYLSGGHTLIPAMKNRLAAPTDLIDLRRIPDLHGIRRRDDRLVIGAATTHADVAASAIVRDAIPALAGLAGSIGDTQVRHLGTMGGSVANNDPAADYPAAVLGLAAELLTDRRRIAADAFFDGIYTTVLEPGEILREIAFPIPQAAGYAKFRNPASRYALAAAFVARLSGGCVRVAITGAGNSGVFRWEDAESALYGRFEPDALAGMEPDATDMMSDMHGSAEYRADLAAAMTRRATGAMGGVNIL
ncbi:xanthine dehydrogenase family protein subunit M [Halovulum dunhuangense]|uniref:Xanthine dehydrogenase family protein subunit M n=1 Tax=Halovulum dunhuangense TaxID=1505036 RepID=A0A849L341_9RHOB|nr:xanthine dehydrogenase family protein subunit M [Halovulum dunhuangense]NNU80788.1 xanthine dehydrogenase family protein subunit M [Halovulum dunhuangense]